jgi:hypothetical protein
MQNNNKAGQNNIDKCKCILLAKSCNQVQPISARGIHELSRQRNPSAQMFLGQSVAPS